MSTYQDLLDEARGFVNDAETPYRDEDATYIRHINRGLQEIGRVRPDALFALFSANTLNVPVVIESGSPTGNQVLISADFQLDMQFYPPLLSYVVGMIELKEDEFTDDGRAITLITAFRNSLLSV